MRFMDLLQVLLGVTAQELDILDKFEDFEYEKRAVDVTLMVCNWNHSHIQNGSQRPRYMICWSFLQDTSEVLKAYTYIWANSDDPNLYGEWDFEVKKFVIMFYYYNLLIALPGCLFKESKILGLCKTIKGWSQVLLYFRRVIWLNWKFGLKASVTNCLKIFQSVFLMHTNLLNFFYSKKVDLARDFSLGMCQCANILFAILFDTYYHQKKKIRTLTKVFWLNPVWPVPKSSLFWPVPNQSILPPLVYLVRS